MRTAENLQERIHSVPTIEEMPTTADVVIIGGGMAGPSAAWALEKASPGIKTVLLEQGYQLANGASAASIENFRTCWPTESLAHMMGRSIDVLIHADEYLGEGAAEAIDIKKRGYLYCGFDGEDVERMKEEVQHMHEIGFPATEFLDSGEVLYRYPWLGKNVVAAKFDPIAGWLNSKALGYQYAKSAKNAEFFMGMQGTRIIIEGDTVVGVSTEKGVISTENVIIAAGPGTKELGDTAGIDIPVVVRPRQSFIARYRHEQMPADAPFVIGGSPHPYVRPTGQEGTIFGGAMDWTVTDKAQSPNGVEAYLQKPEPLEQFKNPKFPSLVLGVLANNFGHASGEGFSDSRYIEEITEHRIGYYVSRDPGTTFSINPEGSSNHYDSERAIIGPMPGIEGLYLSTAHVGHGVMSSPAAGEIVAAHVLKQDGLDPLFYQFDLNVRHVENDGGSL